MSISKIDPAGLDIGQIGGRRNLIINGAMQVAQRGTSATGIGNGDSGTYNTVDRWKWQYSGSITSEYTESQSTDSPDDFSFSRKFECTTAGSGHNYIEMFQPIEAQNLTQLNYGTASAKTITLSFWAKCSQTGTGSVFVYSADSGRAFTGNYTISAVDTWEYKTILISGDTAGSGIASDTGEGLRVSFGLAAASGYTSGTADTWAAYDNANRYAGLTLNISSGIGEYLSITGVQLEVGSVATPFEHRSYGEELALCQRYYTGGTMRFRAALASGSIEYFYTFPSFMRAIPTVTVTSGSINTSTTTTNGATFTSTSAASGVCTFTADAEL